MAARELASKAQVQCQLPMVEEVVAVMSCLGFLEEHYLVAQEASVLLVVPMTVVVPVLKVLVQFQQIVAGAVASHMAPVVVTLVSAVSPKVSVRVGLVAKMVIEFVLAYLCQ